MSPGQWASALLLLCPVVAAAQEKEPPSKGDIPFLEKTWDHSLFSEESKGQAQKWIDDAPD